MSNYKIGETTFNTEDEYKNAQAELKRIKSLMAEHDTTTAAGAKKLLALLNKEQKFTSPFGENFINQLQKTAGESEDTKKAKEDSKKSVKEKASNKTEDKEKNSKKKAVKKENKPSRVKEGKIHVFTKRNLIIGAVVIALIVLAKIFIPQLFNKETTTDDATRNVVLMYAKNQVELKADFYNYYRSVSGMEKDAALMAANEVLSSSYAVNLSTEEVADYTDEQIKDVYRTIKTAGDYRDEGFIEPNEITKLKEQIEDAKKSGLLDSSYTEDVITESDTNTDEVNELETKIKAINSIMDYQEKLYYEMESDYLMAGLLGADASTAACSDLEKIYEFVIYEKKLTDSEKEAYFEQYTAEGLIKDGKATYFDTNPANNGLPKLISHVSLEYTDEAKGNENFVVAQKTVSPKSEVLYELRNEKKTGYILFRKNGSGSDYVQDESGQSVLAQGDYYLNLDDKVMVGLWYYNSDKIGMVLDGAKEADIVNIYDIMY